MNTIEIKKIEVDYADNGHEYEAEHVTVWVTIECESEQFCLPFALENNEMVLLSQYEVDMEEEYEKLARKLGIFVPSDLTPETRCDVILNKDKNIDLLKVAAENKLSEWETNNV